MKNIKEEIINRFEMTELGMLPYDWGVVELGLIADVKGGKRLPKGNSFTDVPTKFPYVRVTDFYNWSVKLNDLRYLTENDAQLLSRYTISSNDVYISIAGSIGYVGTIPNEIDGANLTENAAKLVIKDISILDKSFLVAFLASQKGHDAIELRTTKTSQPKLALARIKQIPIPVPPLSEQRRIAAVLSAIQEAKEKTENVIKAAKELKKSLLRYLFTYGVVPVEEAENVLLKETEIGRIPDTWEVTSAKDIFSKVTDGTHDTPQKLSSGIPLVTSKQLKNGKIMLSEIDYYISESDHLFINNRSKVDKYDILFSMIGTVGEVALVVEEPNFSIKNMGLFKSDNNFEVARYCFYYFASENAQSYVKNNLSGTSQKYITLGRLRDFPIPFPALQNEMQSISQILSKIDSKIHTEQGKRSALDDLFKTLLHNLMTGKVRVNNLEV